MKTADFWAGLRQMSSGCREFTGKLNNSGYGFATILDGPQKLRDSSHRVAYALTHGPIPEGKWVLHHCDNRPCCNPDHLYLGGASENQKDAYARGRIQWNAAKTHCKRGHPFSVENTYVRTKSGYVQRLCKSCRRDDTREWHRLYKEKHGYWYHSRPRNKKET